jgi:tetratricopeptide (TPR) repeat protein
MLNTMDIPQPKKNNTKIFKRCSFVLLFLVCIYSFMYSYPYYRLGDLFFGSVPALYNARFAQFFFGRAAHPFFGSPAPYAHHELSRTYFIQGDLLEALKDAQEELRLYPDHTATYYILGLTYGYMGRTQSAIDAFSHYIDTHPETWAGRNDLAWIQFRAGDIQGALETIQPAYKMYPDNPWVLNTYGVLLINSNKLSEAQKILQEGSTLANSMTLDKWGRAYPGNDPRVYATGLSAMQKSFKDNLLLVEKKMRAK